MDWNRTQQNDECEAALPTTELLHFCVIHSTYKCVDRTKFSATLNMKWRNKPMSNVTWYFNCLRYYLEMFITCVNMFTPVNMFIKSSPGRRPVLCRGSSARSPWPFQELGPGPRVPWSEAKQSKPRWAFYRKNLGILNHKICEKVAARSQRWYRH